MTDDTRIKWADDIFSVLRQRWCVVLDDCSVVTEDGLVVAVIDPDSGSIESDEAARAVAEWIAALHNRAIDEIAAKRSEKA